MKKVLIITYYWPPAGGSGVQRWLKFAKYLPENGWKPIIYTPESPYLEIFDKDLSKDIHADTVIWKYPIWEPYNFKNKLFGKNNKTQSAGVVQKNKSFKSRLMLWIRGNFFIPDPKKYWINPSIRFLKEKLKHESIDTIITTGPPHSMHLIGHGIKKDLNIKWIADFRDPWSELDLLNEFYLSKSSKRKHQKLEEKVLQSADICLTVSENWTDSFKRLGAKNVELITNGFDEEDFLNSFSKQEKFIIGHYGLLNHLRHPKILWKVLNDLCKESSIFNTNLEIHLAGNVDPIVSREIYEFPYLKSKVKELGYITHKEVLQHYNQTSILLLLLFNSTSGIGNYPGKLFEYFAAKRPILAFGPAKSDTQKIIKETKSGKYYSYDTDPNDLKNDILSFFKKRDEKFLNEDIDKFSRKKLTKKLVKILNNLHGCCS